MYCFVGAVLGFIGLIHAERVGWAVGGQVALGYVFAGLILSAFWLVERRRPTVASHDGQIPAKPQVG
jgi:AGZA family xanthine/uracil permease-like MFS transporter